MEEGRIGLEYSYKFLKGGELACTGQVCQSTGSFDKGQNEFIILDSPSLTGCMQDGLIKLFASAAFPHYIIGWFPPHTPCLFPLNQPSYFTVARTSTDLRDGLPQSTLEQVLSDFVQMFAKFFRLFITPDDWGDAARDIREMPGHRPRRRRIEGRQDGDYMDPSPSQGYRKGRRYKYRYKKYYKSRRSPSSDPCKENGNSHQCPHCRDRQPRDSYRYSRRRGSRRGRGSSRE